MQIFTNCRSMLSGNSLDTARSGRIRSNALLKSTSSDRTLIVSLLSRFEVMSVENLTKASVVDSPRVYAYWLSRCGSSW